MHWAGLVNAWCACGACPHLGAVPLPTPCCHVLLRHVQAPAKQCSERSRASCTPLDLLPLPPPSCFSIPLRCFSGSALPSLHALLYPSPTECSVLTLLTLSTCDGIHSGRVNRGQQFLGGGRWQVEVGQSIIRGHSIRLGSGVGSARKTKQRCAEKRGWGGDRGDRHEWPQVGKASIGTQGKGGATT